jgi:hypothetical protein
MAEKKPYASRLTDSFKGGKYAGKTIQQVIDTDISYVKSCLRNVEGFLLDSNAFDYLVEKNKSKDKYKVQTSIYKRHRSK